MEADSDATGEESEQPRGFFVRIHGDWIEVVAAILLAIATVASAWSAYQASRWSGVQSKNYNDANAERVEAAEYADLAEQEYALDTVMFVDYAAVLHKGDEAAVRYFEDTLFSKELKVATDAWKATDPWSDSDAPSTPFEMPEYRNDNREKGKELRSSAAKKATLATESIEHSDRYILLTVLFASVLFFAGISTKFKSPSIRIGTLSLGTLVFIGSFIVLFFMPVQ